tara:strand:+ start:512 stop:757 length:246 start_codon:yes stop_codon:yes gene_type:complete
MEETNQSPFYGRPWNIEGKFRTYEQAFAEVQQLLLRAVNSGFVIKTKIKRASDGRFVVKTRNETIKLVPEKNKRKHKKKKT